MLAQYVLLSVSVRLSVTRQYCTKTVNRMITQTTPYDSFETDVKKYPQNSDGIAPN